MGAAFLFCDFATSDDALKAKSDELKRIRARADQAKLDATVAAKASKNLKRQVSKELARQAREAEKEQEEAPPPPSPTNPGYIYAPSPIPGLSYDLRRYNFGDDV